uniref:Uncharacterized protein n=2 Tax=Moniliophthora roreri TaxID=221103 RepID=A0A0W0F1U3_MONRR
MNQTSILVHKYIFSEGNSNTQGLASILQEGRRIVDQTFKSSWTNTEAKVQVTFGSNAGPNSYTFAREAPVIQPVDGEHRGTLKEWGDSATEDEILYTEDLLEFEGTTLDDMFITRPEMEIKSPDKRPRTPEDEEPSKRQKLVLDTAPLDNVIPEPHLYPSGDNKAPDLKKLLSYAKSQPIPIHPHTLPISVSHVHSRRAWLIPVRGTLPWDRATSAVVLDPEFSPQTPQPGGTTSSEPIVWTHAALLAFWQYVLSFRQKTKLGSLSLSFTTPETRHSNLNAHLDLSNDDDEEVSLLKKRNQDFHKRIAHPLASVVYIKIYHYAEVSMHVRHGIDLFRFKTESPERRIKVMEGARLVLVDELSNGVLIS